jgi:hypothetical protein
MAKMWDILQLFAELQAEAEPGPTLPTLLGSYWKANTELLDGEHVAHSICYLHPRGSSTTGQTRS